MAHRGFTLLEVLMALGILAVAMLALVQTGSRAATNAASLQQRTLAHWVAQDVLARVRLMEAWPALGIRQGETQQLGQAWFWTLEVRTTEEEDMRRLEVRVSDRPHTEAAVARLDGFVARLASAPVSSGP